MENRFLCPKCSNVVVLPEIKFDVMNDYGWIVVECDCCKTIIITSTINPDEINPIRGGRKIKSYDEEIYDLREILAENPAAIQISEQIRVQLPSKQKAMYDYNEPSIHFCSKCGKSLDSLAKNMLFANEISIQKEYCDAMDCILAGQEDADQIVVRINQVCDCGESLELYYAKEFKADAKPLNFKLLDFVATNQEINGFYINRLATKTECMSILGKFIARWNSIADQIVLVTPFIGNQFLNAEKLANEWKWLFDRVEPSKTRLITRSRTLNQFKKKYPELGIDEMIWQKFDLEEKILTGMKEKPNNFHAKFYAGIINGKVELLSGSFNLVGGPSYEQITFETISLDNFITKYLLPLKIQLNVVKRDCPVIDIHQNDGEWIPGCSTNKKIFDL